jgi:amino acid transporter
MAVIPAGEVRDPQRNLPIALLIAIGVVTLLYILIQTVSIGTLPGLANSERPIADASLTFMGTAGASIITAGVLVSITGNLIVLILAGSRLPFAMAERNELPQIISATHNRFHTPHIAILITSAVMLALTLSGTFIYAATISTIARLLAYAATCAALPIFRYRADAPKALFKIPFGTAVALISLVLAGWLLSKCTFTQARDALIATLAGLLIYGAYYLARRSKPEKLHSEES